MCRHCERIVEDVQHKETVHKFMQAAADGVNRKLREERRPPDRLVTADDIDIRLEVTVIYWRGNPFYGTAATDFVYRGLMEAME